LIEDLLNAKDAIGVPEFIPFPMPLELLYRSNSLQLEANDVLRCNLVPVVGKSSVLHPSSEVKAGHYNGLCAENVVINEAILVTPHNQTNADATM
jgi:hypothetical protein